MARILHSHPGQSRYAYHIYTDLDFWDARKILGDLAEVRRNYTGILSGDELPTQVVSEKADPATVAEIERKLRKSVASPARHVVVRSMIEEGSYEFDPLLYYPSSWSRSRMLRFTLSRLPMEQSALCNAYQVSEVFWAGDRIRIERVQRTEKAERIIRTSDEASRRLRVPSCL